jgi:hypothetical protein
MRAFLFSLAAFTAVVTDGRGYTPPPALTFYIVSETKFEEGRFIDSPDLPKGGYIGATPDLTVTKLESVTRKMIPTFAVDENGKTTPALGPTLVILMRPEDAHKFTVLTQRAIDRRVLMMLGGRPLIAPFVHEPIMTKSFDITFRADDVEVKEIEDTLDKLVQ